MARLLVGTGGESDGTQALQYAATSVNTRRGIGLRRPVSVPDRVRAAGTVCLEEALAQFAGRVG